jgi:putative ABC transport system permease protein
VRLRNVPDWLVARKIVSDDARLSAIVALAFLGICIVCALALMLARSLDRSGEYSLRRALGATRRTVFYQAATEAGLIGTGAGILQGNVDVYAFDERSVAGLGLTVIEGRDFHHEDVADGTFNRAPLPPVVLITHALAERLFPGRSALGQTIYLTPEPDHPLRVVGVLDRLQTGNAGATADATAAEDSVVLPMVDHGPRGLYLVRARPGQIGAAMAAASDVLRHANGQRIFGKLRPLSEVRAGAYERDRAMAISLGAICSILVFVTALGIVGLTGFWVERRKRQIGIRRALGATRIAVIRYFLIENAMLCGAGVLFGAIAAWAFNVWLGDCYGVPAMPGWLIAASAIAILVLG